MAKNAAEEAQKMKDEFFKKTAEKQRTFEQWQKDQQAKGQTFKKPTFDTKKMKDWFDQ